MVKPIQGRHTKEQGKSGQRKGSIYGTGGKIGENFGI
jgi:hypothetical protein